MNQHYSQSSEMPNNPLYFQRKVSKAVESKKTHNSFVVPFKQIYAVFDNISRENYVSRTLLVHYFV